MKILHLQFQNWAVLHDKDQNIAAVPGKPVLIVLITIIVMLVLVSSLPETTQTGVPEFA